MLFQIYKLTMPVDRRRHVDLAGERFKEEGVYTNSSLEQRNTEESCLRLFEKAEAAHAELDDLPVLNRPKTVNFLRRGLKNLSEGYECLDASRPWLVYWIVHSLELLDQPISEEEKSALVKFIGKCQDPDGGYAGGPGQVPHLAPTYAAVNSLIIIGTEEAYNLTDREKMVAWMDRLRCEDGAFTMHVDGELDIRGVYCALSAARLLNIYSPQLFHNTDQWLLRCQSYEGGFGGVPGMEAHGGYSFCGLAALILMGKEKLCNLDTLLLWGVNRQMRLEGGFQVDFTLQLSITLFCFISYRVVQTSWWMDVTVSGREVYSPFFIRWCLRQGTGPACLVSGCLTKLHCRSTC